MTSAFLKNDFTHCAFFSAFVAIQSGCSSNAVSQFTIENILLHSHAANAPVTNGEEPALRLMQKVVVCNGSKMTARKYIIDA